MGIDLKKMREKLANAKGSGKIWKPKEGTETKVRILPTPDGDPFKEMHFHYNLGKQSVLCPKRNFDEHCPICEFASQMWNEGDEEEKNMAKKLFARQRYFSPIILRGEDNPSVKVWGYSSTVYEKLLKTVLNPEYGDVTDPETGTDFTITYERKGDKSFPDTDLQFSRKPSSLCGELGEEKCAELLDSLPDFDGLYERKSSAQVQEMLDAFIDSDDSDDEGGSDKEKFGSSSSETSDVDSALDDLKA